MAERSRILDRTKGALFGLAIGDSLGAAIEFMDAEAISQRYGRVTEMMAGGPWQAGEWTDDTALALAASQAYALGGFDLGAAAQAMVEWKQSGPKDIGGLTALALGLIEQGVATASDAGKQALAQRPDSAGNGSLMRALPTGLVRRPNDPRLVRESVELSRITHADPRCASSCVVFNTIVASLVHAADEPRTAIQKILDADTIVKDVQKILDADTTAKDVQKILDADTTAKDVQKSLDADTTAKDVQKSLDADTTAKDVQKSLEHVISGKRALYTNQDGIGFVLLCLERAVRATVSASDFEAGLVEVVNAGGDTDTNGAVAGALLGARFGFNAVPARWYHALQGKQAIERAYLLIVEAAGLCE